MKKYTSHVSAVHVSSWIMRNLTLTGQHFSALSVIVTSLMWSIQVDLKCSQLFFNYSLSSCKRVRNGGMVTNSCLVQLGHSSVQLGHTPPSQVPLFNSHKALQVETGQ